ncbi:hypothetical protein QFZ28_005661 [Neobacillus niacini]|uniref:hypothetical protein n=1 Tax=Neobacillus niacini TaxID=86668 RepID=UPI00278586B0|nr:hypothetical protein [Neobacillus niacini]MDQ1005083.1 hypothetical protein [Neobacillus niacini]
MNELAIQLNELIKENNPHVFDLLSNLGRKLYYPKGPLFFQINIGEIIKQYFMYVEEVILKIVSFLMTVTPLMSPHSDNAY